MALSGWEENLYNIRSVLVFELWQQPVDAKAFHELNRSQNDHLVKSGHHFKCSVVCGGDSVCTTISSTLPMESRGDHCDHYEVIVLWPVVTGKLPSLF